jgi:hypothetical protein
MISWKLYSVMLFTVGLVANLAGAQGGSCSDDFTTASVGAGKAWTMVDFDNATGGTAEVSAAGKLELAGRGADIYGKKNQFVGVTRQAIQGDFDVSVKIESQDSTYDWAQAGIIAATDINDLTKGGYVAFDISPSHGFSIFYDKATPAGQLDGSISSGKTAYPAWLRLTKKGLVFSASYKTQASAAWTPMKSEPPASLNTTVLSQIGLFTVSHDTTKTSKVVFDDFTCGTGTALGVHYLTVGRKHFWVSSLFARSPDIKGRMGKNGKRNGLVQRD